MTVFGLVFIKLASGAQERRSIPAWFHIFVSILDCSRLVITDFVYHCLLFQTNTGHTPTFIQTSWQHGQLHILIRRHCFRRRHNVYTKIIESGHRMKRTHVTNIKPGNVGRNSTNIRLEHEKTLIWQI